VSSGRDDATAESALHAAIATGAVSVFRDRQGIELFFPQQLRDANLLREPEQPHGLATSTAKNIVSLMIRSIDRGRDLGAPIVGTYRLSAIEPLAPNRMRPVRGKRPYVPIAAVSQVCALLSPTFQLAIWLMRLVGCGSQRRAGARRR
jgi:hypothetical protein